MYQFDCNNCKFGSPYCYGRSNTVFNFKDDLSLAQITEKKIVEYMNWEAQKEIVDITVNKLGTSFKSYPDLCFCGKEGKPLNKFIEVKYCTRTFMKQNEYMPNCKLMPSETIMFNESVLKHYKYLIENKNSDVYLVYLVFDRPCVTGKKTPIKVFRSKMKTIVDYYDIEKNNNVYQRASGIGDIDPVTNKHLGVLRKFHFPLSLMQEWKMTDKFLSHLWKLMVINKRPYKNYNGA